MTWIPDFWWWWWLNVSLVFCFGIFTVTKHSAVVLKCVVREEAVFLKCVVREESSTLRNRVCPKERITPWILLWGWDWNPKSPIVGMGGMGMDSLLYFFVSWSVSCRTVDPKIFASSETSNSWTWGEMLSAQTSFYITRCQKKKSTLTPWGHVFFLDMLFSVLFTGFYHGIHDHFQPPCGSRFLANKFPSASWPKSQIQVLLRSFATRTALSKVPESGWMGCAVIPFICVHGEQL